MSTEPVDFYRLIWGEQDNEYIYNNQKNQPSVFTKSKDSAERWASKNGRTYERIHGIVIDF